MMVLEEAPVGISDIQQSSKKDSRLSSVMQKALTNDGINRVDQTNPTA